VGRTNGGMVVHLGVVLVAVGLAASGSYKSDRTFLMGVGETVTFEGHQLTYVEPGADLNDRRLRTFALIQIDGGDTYAPAITSFVRAGQSVPTPSVRSRPTEDIFLVLDKLPNRTDDAIRLRVIIRPLVAWLWIGGGLMAFGTALALIPPSRRRATTRRGASERPEPSSPELEIAQPGGPQPVEPELVGD
jgi:cytochrome c-type biogenesis protein CcmF